MRFRTICAATIAAAAGLVGCAEVTVDPAYEIVERHIQARGGARALDAIKSVRTRVEITEPTFTVIGDYRASADGLMRIDIFADGARVFSEGIDQNGAWQRGGGDAPAETSSAAGEAALRHGIEFNLFGLHKFPDRGHQIELDEPETIDGITYQVLKVTLNDGFETFLYVDPASHMITRKRDVRALHPDVDPGTQLIEGRYSDFREMCGVKSAVASVQVDLTSNKTLQTTKVIDQTCNNPESELLFDREANSPLQE